jgi:hypothetical protein
VKVRFIDAGDFERWLRGLFFRRTRILREDAQLLLLRLRRVAMYTTTAKGEYIFILIVVDLEKFD